MLISVMITMISLINTQDIMDKARVNFRARRLELGLTQAGLSRRSGVALATLRKFERTGSISFSSLLNLALVLDYLDKLDNAFEPIKVKFNTMEDIKKIQKKAKQKKRQRGTIS